MPQAERLHKEQYNNKITTKTWAACATHNAKTSYNFNARLNDLKDRLVSLRLSVFCFHQPSIPLTMELSVL